jgi:hypothetical protein
MASVFAAAALSQLYTFQNAFKEVSLKNQDLFGSSVVIIGEAEASSNQIIIWVKNTGKTSFGISGGALNASYWDLFLTFPNETYARFGECSQGSSTNCWSAQILNDQGTTGVWEEGETLQITVHTSIIPPGSYDVRLTLPTGVTCEDNFSLA